ncbi:MAG: ATP-binding cassette domain-containing protein [Ramlibacter sp.]|nr:ATP-binding cassette domain-containing protein [Ramlibacter sp.]
MRVLTGLYQPVGGQILFNGSPVADDQRQAYREQFSTVFNDFHLFQELLGHRELSAERVDALLKVLALEGKTTYEDGRFSTVSLSTGQRKRLAYVVALLDERPVYVLDEFGAEQDPISRRRFYDEWLPALKAAGKTVVVVTHDDAYFDHCDRLVKMDFGRIADIHQFQRDA